jgi:two-component system chemotaxis response regulator CheB
VIGGSAGCIEALNRILPALPAGHRTPVLIVVHVRRSENSLLPELYRQRSPLMIKEAEDKEELRGGTIYFAPPDYHVLVERRRALSLSSEEMVQYSRPSIDVLFESAADVFGPELVGVVLSGANADGAAGLAAVAREGGVALVQKPAAAEVSVMPEAALAACPSAQALTCEEIAAYLREAGA